MSRHRSLEPGGMAYLALGGALTAQAALAVDSLLPALPTVVSELRMTPGSVQLTVGLFMLGFAGGQIAWGWLSDLFGRRIIILVGTGGYIAATLLCAVADSGPELIAWRTLQGLFASASMAATRAMLRDHFTGVKLARQMAALSVVFFLSPILAPQLGAALMLVFGWRGALLVPGLVALMSFLVTWRALAESHPAARRQRHSLATVMQSAWAMARHPLTGLCLGIQGSMSIGLMTWISSSSLILTGHFRVSVRFFTLVFAATALVQLLGSLLCNQLLRFRGAHEVMALGGGLCLAGGALVFLVSVPFVASLWWTMAGMWLYMLGFGLIVPSSTGMALHAFGAIGGLAAAVLGTAQSLVGGLGSVMSAVLYDGSPFSLGVGVALSAALACIAAITLSYRLRKNPEMLGGAEESILPGNPS
jgi:MFS transporter, DHA1 family, multidrug resistance protein